MYKVVTVARLKGVALGILLRGALILTPFVSLGAGSVSLIWTGSTDATVAGYNVYYGNASHSYPNQVFAGTNLSTVVSGLANGQYYFAVTAVDAIGNESDFSNEINYQIAGVNQPPTISAIASQSTYVSQATGPIGFTINDPDTGASGLILSAVSSNTGLVPNGNIVLGGSGGSRTVTITPVAGQTGGAQITITVSDGSLTAQSSFALNVQPIASGHPPTISAIASQTGYAGVANGPFAFTINDQDSGPNSLTLSAASSNTGLVPNGNIVFGGSAGNRTVTITPLAGQTGAAQITITVSDGTLTAQSAFSLNVQQSTALPAASAGKSTYNGLFYDSTGLRVESAGSVKITLATGGKYSGTVQMAGGRYSFSGQFGALCQGTKVILRKGANPLNVSFTLKPGSAGQLTGTLSDGTWTAQLYGGLAGFNSKTNPAPYAGSYTLAIPGQDNPPFLLGNGFGSLKVDGNGNVKLAGALADGTKLSQSAALSTDGTWPLFVPLYSGKGLLFGWVTFVSRASDDLHGGLSWVKLPAPTSHFYPGGLSLASDAVGSTFVPGPQPYALGKAQLQLGETGNGLMMALKVSPTTGVFNGNILNRVTGKPVKFQGALVDKMNAGYGFVVLGTNQSTPVTLVK
jgi:Bacterial Ig domain